MAIAYRALTRVAVPTIGFVFLYVGSANAEVNLEFRKPVQSVCPGQFVRLGFYAVSDDDTLQSLAAIDLVFSWDPVYLDLIGLDQTGAAPLSASFFPPAVFGLNEVVPPQDGDGLYSAYAPFGDPVEATSEGVLITTFVFQAIASTTGPTLVEMLPSGGTPPVDSTVWSGVFPGTPVTGTLSNARVGVTFQICVGDIDDNLEVNLSDLAILLSAFGSTDPISDLNCDGEVGLDDLALLLSEFGTQCA